jgi:Fe-S cluster assembly ATP-binding protein
MLKLSDINVIINKKEILKNINVSFKTWKTYFLVWKNWSGKSSLALSIMWHPDYKINSWKIFFKNKDITNFSPDKKNKLWIFLSFQNIPELQWIKLIEYLRVIYNEHLKTEKKIKTWLSLFLFKKFITPFLNEFKIKEIFLKRDLNVWFSWGEKRKIELLQIALLKPKYIILDDLIIWLIFLKK